MNLLLTLLGGLGLVAVTLLGIVGSGLLTAKQMADQTQPEPITDPTGRKAQS